MAVGIGGPAASMSSGGCADAPVLGLSVGDESDAAAASAVAAPGGGGPLSAEAADQVQAVVDGTVGVASSLYAHTMELTAQQLELQSTMNDLANSGLGDDGLMLDLLDQLCEVTDGLDAAESLRSDVQAVGDAVKAGGEVPADAAQRIVDAGHQDVIDMILDTGAGTLQPGESASSMASSEGGDDDADAQDDAAAAAAAAQPPSLLQRANLDVTTFDDGSSAATPAAACAC
ncbi:MAG: hypothetical protein JWM98_2695 [Thermoleophilia bacterium]|nr:hypothetical protein [Thermoleophilia bacterium]